jgi:heat shock protein HslJ/uncharacterized membrane protein
MKTILALVPLALALAACETYPDDPYGPSGYPPAPYPGPYPEPYPQPYPQPYPPAPYPDSQITYRASGTEPFWDLTIGRDLVFTDRGNNNQVVQPTPPVQIGVAGEIYNTPRINVNIVHARCSDGMSDRNYPDTIQVRVEGRDYRGCGDRTVTAGLQGGPVGPPAAIAPPLDLTRWRVVSVNGRPVPAGDYHIDFEAGRIAAKFGCNGIGGSYTQTGSTLDAGALISTKMACPDMSWESQGSAVLDKVMTVGMIGPNRLTLTSSAGSIDLVRR